MNKRTCGFVIQVCNQDYNIGQYLNNKINKVFTIIHASSDLYISTCIIFVMIVSIYSKFTGLSCVKINYYLNL